MVAQIVALKTIENFTIFLKHFIVLKRKYNNFCSLFISSKVKEFGDNDLEYLIQINKFNYKHININF